MLPTFDDIDWEKSTLRQLKTFRKIVRPNPSKFGLSKADLELLEKWIKKKQTDYHVQAGIQASNRIIEFLKRATK